MGLMCVGGGSAKRYIVSSTVRPYMWGFATVVSGDEIRTGYNVYTTPVTIDGVLEVFADTAYGNARLRPLKPLTVLASSYVENSNTIPTRDVPGGGIPTAGQTLEVGQTYDLAVYDVNYTRVGTLVLG